MYSFFILISVPLAEICIQIAREMVISPQNSRLGLMALTKRVGLVDRPDSPDGELIRYRVYFFFDVANIYIVYLYIVNVIYSFFSLNTCSVGRPSSNPC